MSTNEGLPVSSRKPKQTFYDEPRVMYLGQSRDFIKEHWVIGETTRSWLTGTEYCVSRWSKANYLVFTKAEYDASWWLSLNRFKILQKVDSCSLDPVILRQIAELIGYVEEPEGQK